MSPKISAVENISFKMVPITASWLLRYPKNDVTFLLYVTEGQYTYAYPYFVKTRNTIEWLNPILLTTLQVNVQYGCYYTSRIVSTSECDATSHQAPLLHTDGAKPTSYQNELMDK